MSLSSLIGDSKYYLATKIFAVLYWVYLIKIMTTWFSPEKYGVFALLNSSTVLLSSLVTMPRSSLLRFFTAYRESGEEVLRSFISELFTQLIALIVLISTILWSLSQIDAFRVILPEEAPLPILLLFFSMFCLSGFLLETYRAGRHLRSYSSMIIINLALNLVFIHVAMIVNPGQMNGIFLALSASHCLVIAIVFFRQKIKMTLGWSRELVTKSFHYGWPIIFINILTQVLIMGDQYIFRATEKHKELGIYAANYAIAENSILAFTSLLGSTFIPILFSKSSAPKEAEKFLITARNIYLLVMLPVTCIFVFFSGPVAKQFLRAEYHSGAQILPIVSIGAFFLGLSNVYSERFTLKRRTKELMYCYLGAAICNISVNVFAIPRFGLAGAAWTTLLSYLTLCGFVITVGRRLKDSSALLIH